AHRVGRTLHVRRDSTRECERLSRPRSRPRGWLRGGARLLRSCARRGTRHLPVLEPRGARGTMHHAGRNEHHDVEVAPRDGRARDPSPRTTVPHAQHAGCANAAALRSHRRAASRAQHSCVTPSLDVRIVPATETDTPVILSLIKGLADYERLAHEVEATAEGIHESLFGDWPAAEVVLAYVGSEVAGFALFFHNFSTFLGRRGLYLEDLFVLPPHRGRGVGRRLLSHLARVAIERRCGRMEWWVLDWNESAIRFYKSIGARPMDDWTVYRLDGDA